MIKYPEAEEAWSCLSKNGINAATPEEWDRGSRAALSKQVGNDHYKKQKIQPIEYTFANNLGFCEGNVVKYITRYKDKNGIEDLEKAKHYIELLIEELTNETND